MSRLQDYQDSFRNIRFERRNGILQVDLHTDGGPLQWGALQDSVHAQTRTSVLTRSAAIRTIA